MAWTIRDAKRELAIIERIENGEPRAAAVLAGAYLEDRLTDTLRSRMVQDRKLLGKFFKGYGPLATFSAKIDLAYLLGIAPEPLFSRLHTIREIRNRFAHRLDCNSFKVPAIYDLCRKLYRPPHIKFLADKLAVVEEDGELNPAHFVMSPLVGLEDTPRNSYMSSIKILLVVLEATTQVNLRHAGLPQFGVEFAVVQSSSREKPA